MTTRGLSLNQVLPLGLYAGGRYSPKHERGVRHFHRLLAQAL